MELLIDENRLEEYGFDNHTGIFVRAKYPGNLWESADIILLTKESLLEWLRSRGGENTWAKIVLAFFWDMVILYNKTTILLR